MTFELAHRAGWDAADRHMRKAGRATWNESDLDVATKTAYELFPPCFEGFNDVCECSRCKAAR